MDKKKIDELKQLRTFYSEVEYKVIRQYENPDFVLKDSKNNIFGVEVTKYYDTPTSGRFKNIPNYVENIVNSKFIHKKDVGILEVGEITKIDDKGKEISLPDKGVLRKIPQSPERIKILQELVSKKNLKYIQQYDKSLDAIDLLICDSGDLIAGLEIQKTQILNYLRKQEKANSLKSPFRNIILVISEPSGKVIKILLKSG